MNKSLFLFTSFLLLLTCIFGQNKQDDELTKKLNEILSAKFKTTAPGCEVLVAKKGKIVYKKAFGSADLELNVPMQPDMLFKLGSITKQFTAVAILQLFEQGKISLQDSLQRYVKGFPSKGNTITIENLLTHTSGIKDFFEIDYPQPYMERRDYTPEQLIDSFKNIPLEFEPGTKFKYSNSGYFILGYIIEQVSGKSFQTYIKENILTPLSLNHTYFDSLNNIIPNKVSGYRQDGLEYRNADFWSSAVTYSAGGLVSNVDDLFKWHQGLYAYKILRKETLEKAFKPFTLQNGTLSNYGYGWFLKTSNGIKSIEHAGGLPGFLTNEIYFTNDDIFISILSNCECSPVDELSITLSGLALGKALQNAVKVNSKILAEYIGTYVLTIDSTKKIDVVKEKDRLVAKVSNNETIPLIFQSDTKFQFKNLLDADCEFVKENGKVAKFNVIQNGGHFVWIKTK